MINTDKEDTIINFDFQNWPIHKMNLRDIISKFMTFNKNTNKYEISNDNPILDIYPVTLEDDGMGYGVNEKYIFECNLFNDEISNEHKLYIFLYPELKNINLWLKYNHQPYEDVYINKDEKHKYVTTDIKEENNNVYIYCEDRYSKLYSPGWINIKELYIKIYNIKTETENLEPYNNI